MKNTALARRYAQALIDIGKEDNNFERYGKEIRDILAVLSGDDNLYKVLLNPMFKLEEREALAGGIADKLGASETVKKFFTLLVTSGNLRLIDDIVLSYARLEDELAGRVRATIVAPGELSKTLLDDVKSRLSKETGKEIVLTFDKDPSLVGGVVIKLGNTVLDGSIKTQIEKMKAALTQGAA